MVVSSVSTFFNLFQATNLQPKRKKGVAPVSGGVEKAGHFRMKQCIMRISVTYYINLDDIAGALRKHSVDDHLVEDNYLKAVGRVLSGDGPVDKHKASQVRHLFVEALAVEMT